MSQEGVLPADEEDVRISAGAIVVIVLKKSAAPPLL